MKNNTSDNYEMTMDHLKDQARDAEDAAEDAARCEFIMSGERCDRPKGHTGAHQRQAALRAMGLDPEKLLKPIPARVRPLYE